MSRKLETISVFLALGLGACARDEGPRAHERPAKHHDVGEAMGDDEEESDDDAEAQLRLSSQVELPPCDFGDDPGSSGESKRTRVFYVAASKRLMACNGSTWTEVSDVKPSQAGLALAESSIKPPKDFVAVGASQCVKLAWVEPGGDETAYLFRYAFDDEAFKDWEYYQVRGKAKITFCHPDLLRRPFRIVAHSVDKSLRKSAESEVVTLGSLVPEAMSGFTAKHVANSNCADLSWATSAGAAAYRFTYQIDGGPAQNWQYNQTYPNTQIRFCEGRSGSKVTIRGVAVALQGHASKEAVASVEFPSLPLGSFKAYARASSDDAVTITWTDVPGASNYYFYYQESANGVSYNSQVRWEYYAHAGTNTITLPAVSFHSYAITAQAVDGKGMPIANSNVVQIKIQPNYCTYVLYVKKRFGVVTNVGTAGLMFSATGSSWAKMDDACVNAQQRLINDTNAKLAAIASWQARKNNYSTYGEYPASCGAVATNNGPLGSPSSWERCFIGSVAGAGYSSASGVAAQ